MSKDEHCIELSFCFTVGEGIYSNGIWKDEANLTSVEIELNS